MKQNFGFLSMMMRINLLKFNFFSSRLFSCERRVTFLVNYYFFLIHFLCCLYFSIFLSLAAQFK